MGIDPRAAGSITSRRPRTRSQRYLFRTPARRQGQAGAAQPAREARHPRLRRRAQLQLRHRDLLQLRQPADHPPGPASRAQPIRTLVDNQALRARVTALRRGADRVARLKAEDGAQMPGMLMKPADFDSTRKYPLALLRVRRARQDRGGRRVGRLLPLAHDADPEGLPGGHRGQPRHARGRSAGSSARRSTGSWACWRPGTRRPPRGRWRGVPTWTPAASGSGAGATAGS